jgi:hypothetical protein
MSEYVKRLDIVQQEIKDLLKKERRLKKKEQNGQLLIHTAVLRFNDQ